MSDTHTDHTHDRPVVTEHPPSHGVVSAHESAAVREPFGVAQAVALLLGILFIVLGAVGLARSGLESLTEPRAEIGGIGATPLLSMIHLVIGLVGLVGATSRGAARSVCMFLGPLLIAMGLIALIEPIRQLGFDEVNGIVYMIAGIAAIAAAVVTPVASLEERRVTTL